jgi:ankyrin repeat protein
MQGAKISKTLLQREYDKIQCTPLHLAAIYGHEAVKRALVEGGADLNTKGKSYTPLHCGFFMGHEAGTRALVVEGGADLKFSGCYGSGRPEVLWVFWVCRPRNGVFWDGVFWDPLHIAVFEGHEAVTRALVKGGADVNAKDYLSRATPLHIAVFKGHKAVMRALVKGKADVNDKDYLAQYTPQYTLHWAVISIIHG